MFARFCWLLIPGVLLLFQLMTLPLEFDASRRAGRLLRECGMASPQD